MKKQLMNITLFFVLLITVITLIFSIPMKANLNEELYRKQLIDINEIVQLSEKDDEESLNKRNQALMKFRKELAKEQTLDTNGKISIMIWILYGLCITFLLLVFAYIYRTIIRPFNILQNYADEIARGNFDIDLRYERTNYFGKFTWAFDHMRREITKARACEKEAIDNNKTVIATLSHDIKTPIASIRAYAEGLDANLDSGPEMRRKYSLVIMIKCDEVTKLTNDLFLHSLSDLDKLKINMTRENIRELLIKIISELQLNDSFIRVTGELPDAYVMIDEKRFEQVMENLINNTKKYAPESNIEISSDIGEDNISICVQDYGEGIPDEDMPFIFDKFYRGSNARDRQGSGLGLYIVRYIMKQMGGSVDLISSSEGLRVILKIPYCS